MRSPLNPCNPWIRNDMFYRWGNWCSMVDRFYRLVQAYADIKCRSHNSNPALSDLKTLLVGFFVDAYLLKLWSGLNKIIHVRYLLSRAVYINRSIKGSYYHQHYNHHCSAFHVVEVTWNTGCVKNSLQGLCISKTVLTA